MREYGPHDPATAPSTVPVLGAGKWPQAHDVRVPAALARQRAQLNEAARVDH